MTKLDRAKEQYRGPALGGLWTAGGRDRYYRLGTPARLYVNFFQPSFKLQSKTQQGVKVTKRYHVPATPYERILADSRVTNESKEHLRQIFSSLDPIQLLQQIRAAQQELAEAQVGRVDPNAAETDMDLSRF